MRPRLKGELVAALRAAGGPPPWRCKLHLRRGRTIYGAEVNEAGEIVAVGGRSIYSAAGLGFGMASVERVTPY